MGRPSKLTEKQWGEIGRRLAKGETMRTLAREYKVGVARISERFSERVPEIKALANTIATAELAFERLPVSEQCSVRSLADQLKGIQSDYAKASAIGVKNSVRLHSLAQKKLEEVREDDLSIGAVGECLIVVDGLTRAANRSASLASRMVTDNKGNDDRERSLEDLLEEVNQKARLG